MADIRLEGVSKHFGEATAVESLDLAVGDGEFVVLLGPTGAGKTTTLRLIAGLEKPDAGLVYINGHDAAPCRRPSGMWPSSFSNTRSTRT